MFRKNLLILLMMTFCTSAVYSQGGRSYGLGGAYTALARGPEAMFWNPANLALSSGLPNVNLKLYSIGFNLGNNAFNIDFYNDYFTGTGQTDAQGNDIGKILTESDKNDIIEKVPSEGWELRGRADMSVLAFNYKNYGFSIEGNVFGKAYLPKNAFEIFLKGLEQNTYSFDVDGEGYGIARAKFSYGMTIAKDQMRRVLGRNLFFKELAVGWNASIIRGGAYAKVEESDVRLIIADDGFNAPSSVKTREALGGMGFGLDFGIGGVLNNGWRFGFAIDNIPGIIKWSKDAKEEINSFDLKRNRFIDELSDIEIDDYKETTENELSSFNQTLPLNIRFGVARTIRNYLYNVEVAREYGSFRFSFGGGVTLLRFLEFYAAYTRMQDDNYFSTAMAFNFRHFTFDLGVMNRGGITGNSSKAVTFASTMRIGF